MEKYQHTEDLSPSGLEKARLAMNARSYRHDPQLEHALELFHTDRDRFDRLPGQLKSQVGIYADFRDQYRAAVEAGVIPDDRGPSAASTKGN